MTTFSHGSITAIPTDTDRVQAFRITGHVEDDDMEAMSKYMNKVFDTHDGQVDMLLDLTGMTGRDLDAMFDGDVMKAQMRSWSHVRRYAVIGGPERAEKMIEWSDKIIPVDAKTFKSEEAADAWTFVGARPQAHSIPV